MLVLTRRENDKILFPELGIRIELLRLKKSSASVGIEAPRDIRILREELVDATTKTGVNDVSSDSAIHDLRNQVNRATLKLQLSQKLFRSGKPDSAMEIFAEAVSELTALTGRQASANDEQKPHNVAPEYFAATARRVGGDGESSVDQPHVLLVDDDENERKLMASYLRRCGLSVSEASDGVDALNRLNEGRVPDAILMDMKMPRMGGGETLRRIRHGQQCPEVPVLVVSGEAFDDRDGSVNEDGVTAWFQKPVEVDQIVHAIERCIDN